MVYSYDGPSENAAGWTPEEESTQAWEQQVQWPQTAETLAFQELNEELDGIDNDARLVSSYTNILWSFLVRVRNGEIEGLDENDNDFQRLLSLYKAKFEELKDMRDRGQEIEHVIAMHMHLLDHTVDRGAAGEDIDDALDTAYEAGMEEREQQEELNRLEIQRDSQLWVMRELIRWYQSENTTEFTEWTQNFIERNVENFDIAYPVEMTSVQEKTEYLQWTIIPNLWELTTQLQIRLRDEALRVDSEQLWEWRNRGVWERYNTFLETITDAQREIIDGKSFEELWVADFQALWLDEWVDISKWFLRTESGWEITGEVWESMILSFGWNQAIDDLFPSLVPEGVNSIMVDNRLAQRVWETSFEYEWWLPVRVRDGSNIIVQNTETLTPEQETTRRTEFEQVLESNRWRQELEQQVASGLQWRWMLAPHERGEESTMDFLKRIINEIAAMFGFWEIFDLYSEEDLAAIAENGGMQRFIPNGAEILQDWEFMSELDWMCGRLWVQKDHMLVVMQAECWLDHTAVNPTSGASGLIQFMPATARDLWTTVEAIRGMSAIEQLPYVEAYFARYANRMQSVEDIYRVVFYPAAIGKPDNWVFGSQNNSAARVAQQNSGIARHSARADGLIDNNAFARYVQAKVSQFMTTDYSWGQAAQVDGITSESLQALPENRRKVVSKALDSHANRDTLWAAHCTDWVDKIYQSEVGKSVYDASKSYEGWVYTTASTWSRDTWLRTREYAWDSVISQVQAWDHIMVDHWPGFGRGRTHSVIALESPQDGILRVVSYPNGWRPPVIEMYDLSWQWRSWARPEKAMRIHTPV